jgi:acyl-coenzyme A thioesterase 13
MNKVVEQLTQMIGQESKNISPSPYGRWLNGKILEVNEGFLKVSYEIREEFSNPGGIMHGGVLAGMMDELIGMAGYTLNKEGFFVAANINVDFLRPVNVGETVVGTTNVVRAGKTMMHIECQIHNTDNKLVAKAASNLVKMSLKA